MTRDAAIRAINDAFAGATMPLTEQDLAPPSIEAPYVIAHFLGRSRSDIDALYFLPSLHMEDFTYMTAKAVAYYLPPVLELALETPIDGDLWIYLNGFLRSVQHSYSNLRSLDRAQHAAIAAWAEFLSGEPDDSLGFSANEAAELALLYRELAT